MCKLIEDRTPLTKKSSYHTLKLNDVWIVEKVQ